MIKIFQKFCSIQNSFKSRSRLTEFYKHTHPDILHNAPEKIKEENLRSIKLLNQYLDSLTQNLGNQQQNLKFYISDKDNKKGRKFFLIDVHLSPIRPQISTDLQKKFLDESIEKLINGLKITKQKTDPFIKKVTEQDDKIGEKQFYEEYQYEMKPLKKDHFVLSEIIQGKQ